MFIDPGKKERKKEKQHRSEPSLKTQAVIEQVRRKKAAKRNSKVSAAVALVAAAGRQTINSLSLRLLVLIHDESLEF